MACTWLEGTYSRVYPSIGLDEQGMGPLFRAVLVPRRIPSHVAPETPGSIHEGGELGYSVSHAYFCKRYGVSETVSASIGGRKVIYRNQCVRVVRTEDRPTQPKRPFKKRQCFISASGFA